ncbi:MAG TPA: phosphoribosyltransferase family protein, partial [Clostridia bacterium]|nr:phosphoribosyltransferase family protein [Clostridia bacterium]
DREGIKEHKFADTKKSALCVFEHVYIARPDSVIDGLSVYKARYEMGRQLARTAPADADFVAGVPESALPAAKGYAAQSGLPYSDALVRNRFVGRTFIQPTQSMREQGVYLKLSALNKTVEGKSIVLVDDSIVRGTTSKKIVTMLKNAGAKAVHLRIASPPVRFPCRYGVDTPTSEELAGACYSIEYIRDMVGADSLEYITLDGLREAVKDSNLSMCSACFDGDYPLR